MKENPSIIASDIESLDESRQLEMFERINKEDAILYTFGGDCNSLLREIFIKDILDDEGYILATSLYKPMVAFYKDYRFDYIVTQDAETIEDFDGLASYIRIIKELDHKTYKFILGHLGNQIKHKTQTR